jgi:hypothetical protein
VELEGLGVPDLFSYGVLLIPIIVALYVTWKERSDSNILFASWFIILLVLSFFSKRVLLYAAPAACLLSGVGLAYLWGWAGREIPVGRTAFSLTKFGYRWLFLYVWWFCFLS